MHILLITPAEAGGHYLEYRDLLARSFTEMGHDVSHFSLSQERTGKISSCIPGFAAVRMQNRRDALQRWQVLSEHIVQLKNDSNSPDFIFFSFLDEYMGQYITKWDIDRKITIPFSGLLFSPPDAQRVSNRLLRLGPFNPYHLLTSKWCRSVGILVDDSVSFLSELLRKPVCEIADVISVSEAGPDNSMGGMIAGRAGSRIIIGIWGAIEKRKGTGDFLQMCLELPQDRFFFVMGGRVHDSQNWPDYHQEVLGKGRSGEQENLLVIDKWLSDSELLSGMASCNLIFAAYPGFRFTSGIVGKAAYVGVPILVNNGYVMARRVNTYGIGFVKPESTGASEWIRSNYTLIRALRETPAFKEGCSGYCVRYGYEQWRQSLTNLLKA